MSKILYSRNCPFSFRNWSFKKINKIFAGHDCVMAITASGKVLQKVLNKDFAIQSDSWNNMKEIAISNWCPALAVGLKVDGTCVVAKNPLKHVCQNFSRDYKTIYNSIHELKDIVKICVSDAVFALTKFGDVICIPLLNTTEYDNVSTWQNIKHITVGNQNSVFGITTDGKIVCSGRNVIGSYRDLPTKLASFDHVVDISVMGSECESIHLLLEDGRFIDLHQNIILNNANALQDIRSNSLLSAIRCVDNSIKLISYNSSLQEMSIKTNNHTIFSFAVGLSNMDKPFYIAIHSEYKNITNPK